jgi:hypothetical protein
VSEFVRAGNEQDFAGLCGLLAESEVNSLEHQSPGRCPQILQRTSSGVTFTRARIDEVRVSDDRASVDATFIQEDGTRKPQTLRLVKEDGDWKLAAGGG